MRDRVMHRTWRRLASVGLAAGLISVGFVAMPAPASAALQSGAVITSVSASVGPTTPLWNLDLRFDLTGVTCPADLHYKIRDVNFGDTAGKTTICGAGQSAPAWVIVQRPVYVKDGGGVSTLTPSSTALVSGRVYDPGHDTDNSSGGAMFGVNVPPAPVWIGIGDGFTSAVRQDIDNVTTAGYNANDAGLSWITKATAALNSRESVPNEWKVQALVLARDNASLLGGPGTTAVSDQLAAAVAELQAHAGSWNWVGLSAGLEDSGIPAALDAFYTANGTVPPAPKPWDAATVGECPDLSGVAGTISAQSSAMRSALNNLVTTLRGADANVRMIQLLYPYLTEQVNGSYTNPCAPVGWPAIDALNGALQLGNPDVIEFDLRSGTTGFGTQPTGVRATTGGNPRLGIPPGITRTGSFLQLSRPHGYPYPSPFAAVAMGEAAIDISEAESLDLTPPTVVGFPAPNQPSKNDGWYNYVVDIDWSAADTGGSGLPPTTIPGTLADAEGNLRRWESPTVCDNAGNCTVGEINLKIDLTDPVIAVRRSRNPDQGTWYRDPVTVTWTYKSDNLSGFDAATQAPPRVMSTSHAGQVVNDPNTMCDKAGNCTQLATTVNLDMVDPVVTASLPSASASGWYTGPVTVTWNATDQGGSGFARTAQDEPVNTKTWTSTWAGDGEDISITSSQACDLAGRCATGSATFSIDQTKPTVDIVGAEDGATYTTAPSVSCVGNDTGSGLKSCTLDEDVTELADAEGFRYTVTATATDNAGNTSTNTISYTDVGFEHEGTTWVTGNASHTDPEHDFVTYAFRLRCTGGPNAIQVNWDRGLKFRLDEITSVLCYDNPTYEEGEPPAEADTFVFTGTGRYNDEEGASIQIRIADAGEIGDTVSGVGLDRITIVVTAPGGQTVLDTTSLIEAGNLQANGEDIDEVLPEDPEEGEGTYAIFASDPERNILASGIPVRGAGNSANVYSGLTANGTTSSTRTEVAGAADIQGDLHARGGVLVTGFGRVRGDVWASGDVVIDGAATVHGDVIATGSITLRGFGKILGSAHAGGSISIDGAARISGDATANGTITHPTWGSPRQFVGGTETPNAGEDVAPAPELDLPTPPVNFDGNGWPEPYRAFATCSEFNAFLNANDGSGAANRADFHGTYRILEDGCKVVPGSSSRTVVLTGPSAIVADGCIEMQGSSKFVRPSQSTAELWLLSLREEGGACSGGGDNRGIKLSGGSWLSSVPTFLYARGEVQVTGGVMIWGQIYAREVDLAGGFGLEFKPFKLPCFSGEAISSGGDCSVPGGGESEEEPEYEWPEGGVFVIGDETAHGPGGSVYYWGSQWRQNNPASGSTHRSFKGFQNTTGTPACGGTWSSSPGNSSGPPDEVPEYMAVIVSSHVDKNGSTLSGDVAAIVIVKTQPGYGPAPGHVGKGQVVEVLCEA